MSDLGQAFFTALTLIGRLDDELIAIVFLSLRVSLTASALAFVIGAPLGIALAIYRFPGRGWFVVLANSLLGLPPVVVGLAVYLLLSRAGPFGSLGWLFTPAAMVCADRARHSDRDCARTPRLRVAVEAIWRQPADERRLAHPLDAGADEHGARGAGNRVPRRV